MNPQTSNAATVQSKIVLSLPGNPKFASFKNSLQEYCQKLKLEKPVYKTEKTLDGNFTSTVSFGTNFVVASQNHGTIKQAERQVSFDALRQLEYLSDTQAEYMQQFISAGSKRKSSPMADEGPPAKQVPATFKQRLNQMAQKREITDPTFETVEVADVGFLTSVSFADGKSFTGAIQAKKKNAEQSAAHITLFCSGFVLDAPPGFNTTTGEFESAARLIAAPSIDSSFTTATSTSPVVKKAYKSRLLEYCQKNKLPAPIYNTIAFGDETAKSTVNVAGHVVEASAGLNEHPSHIAIHGKFTVTKRVQKQAEEEASKKACLLLEQEQEEKAAP